MTGNELIAKIQAANAGNLEVIRRDEGYYFPAEDVEVLVMESYPDRVYLLGPITDQDTHHPDATYSEKFVID